MNIERNIEIKQAILDKIKQYDTVVISRHVRPDGDAIGSSHGLAQILRASFPEKRIIVANEDNSDYLAFLGTGETDPGTVDHSIALGIVVDTANLDRVANKRIKECKELIKIDHHIVVENYGSINWVEEDRSSVCEMIAYLQYTFRENLGDGNEALRLDQRAATLLYMGICTDSGRFRYQETSGDTFRIAGYLFDWKLNTEWLYSNLYLEEFDYFKFQAHVFEKMRITENGVAYLYVDNAMQEKFGLGREQASSSVDFMSKIKGSIVWLAFIDNGDGSIRVRLRSRFITINKLAEKYHGGGHANASGSTVYSLDEMHNLISDADALVRDYKAEHEGWL